MPNLAPENNTQLVTAISNAGWRTGSACSPNAFNLLQPYMPSWVVTRMEGNTEGRWVPIISSQVCDLVHGDLESEPHAEFILGQIGIKQNANLAPKRSWRRIQLVYLNGVYVEFCVHDRWTVKRDMLVVLPRDEGLDLPWSQGLDLAKWIGGRYARYPLPDALVERMQLNSEKPKKWLKALTEDVEELRIHVTPPDQELPASTPYNVVLYAILTVRGVLSTTKANEAYDSLQKWLGRLTGVTVQLRLMAADKFTYAMMKETHHFDVDAITFGYKDGPKGATGIEL